MTKDLARLIADSSYREEFFQQFEHVIDVLKSNGEFEAVRGYCLVRTQIEVALKMYGIDSGK
jgi:hypothetical protein